MAREPERSAWGMSETRLASHGLAGAVSRPSSSSTSMVQMSYPPLRRDMKAIVGPTGDQSGRPSYASSSVSRTASPPEARTAQMSLCPERSESNAIHLPSGLHVGNHSLLLVAVRRFLRSPVLAKRMHRAQPRFPGPLVPLAVQTHSAIVVRPLGYARRPKFSRRQTGSPGDYLSGTPAWADELSSDSTTVPCYRTIWIFLVTTPCEPDCPTHSSRAK